MNILGYGFVGSSLGYLCEKNKIPFNIYDVNTIHNINYFNNLAQLVIYSEFYNDLNYYFICVPTPPDSNGNCDISIVANLIEEINKLVTKKTIIIIKSTLKPSSCNKLSLLCVNDNTELVLYPEFLREKTANIDMYNSNFALFGVNNQNDTELITNLKYLIKTLYKHKFGFLSKIFSPKFKFIFKPYSECELFKYTLNVFLAVKVWYFNEIYEICEKLNIDYNNFKQLLILDNRIGTYGTIVPGEDCDGSIKFSFNKKCLTKESKAFKYLQDELSIPSNVFDEFLKRNDQLRLKKI